VLNTAYSYFGCDVVSPPVISATDLNAQQIIMDNSYVPLAIQKQIMGCIRSDANQQYNADLGDELLCVIGYKRSETQIDKFNVIVGNGYSDYAKDGDQAQYLQFTIPTEEVMFNDVAMMSNALIMEKGTQGTHTWGDLILYGANKVLGATGTYSFFNGITDAGQYFTSNGFIKNVGWDLNFDEQLNPNTYDGLFFFKLNGLQVINQYDYTYVTRPYGRELKNFPSKMKDYPIIRPVVDCLLGEYTRRPKSYMVSVDNSDAIDLSNDILHQKIYDYYLYYI
jgi:hypothetical protein